MQNVDFRMQNENLLDLCSRSAGCVFPFCNLNSAFCILFSPPPHSYLSASTGSSFEARSAGTSPLATPTASKTRVDSMTVAMEICR